MARSQREQGGWCFRAKSSRPLSLAMVSPFRLRDCTSRLPRWSGSSLATRAGRTGSRARRENRIFPPSAGCTRPATRYRSGGVASIRVEAFGSPPGEPVTGDQTFAEEGFCMQLFPFVLLLRLGSSAALSQEIFPRTSQSATKLSSRIPVEQT